jgi:hypothetical protein
MSKTLKDKLPEGISARELNLSPSESKKRIKNILYQQRAIRKSINYSQADLEKIYFPQFGPNYGR